MHVWNIASILGNDTKRTNGRKTPGGKFVVHDRGGRGTVKISRYNKRYMLSSNVHETLNFLIKIIHEKVEK